jgi:hypothetical protein
MIRHETPTEDLQAFQCGVMAEEFQVLSPVFVREENCLAIIPTCGIRGQGINCSTAR